MADKTYPTFDDIVNIGGTVIDNHTSVGILLIYCADDTVLEVLGLVSMGYSVLMFNGMIKAADRNY